MKVPFLNPDEEATLRASEPDSRSAAGEQGLAERLSRSEELVLTIAENATSALIMMDKRGYCTFCNPAWLAMTGYSAEEIRSRPLHDLVHHHHPDGRPFPKEECPIYRALPEDLAVRAHEGLFFRKDGSTFPVVCAASPVFEGGRGPDGKGIGQQISTVIEVRDVTAEKAALEAQRQADDRYQRQMRLFEGIASTTPDFIYVFDLEGRFQYANRRLLEVWGMQITDVVGKTCRELGYEQWHHEMHMREIAQVIETRAPIKGEVPFKAPLTGIFGVYEYIFTPVIGPDGQVELIAGTTRDVTERKQSEEALRKSEEALRENEERFRLALAASPIILFEQDRELRYTWIHNQSPEFSSETVIGRTDDDLLGRDAEELTRLKRAVLESGRGLRREITMNLAGGARTYLLVAEPLIRNGGVEGIECAGIDITEQKRQEGALREREALLSAVLDALPVAVIIAAPQGRLLRMNRACERIFGPSPQSEKIEEYGEWTGYWPGTDERLEPHDWPLSRALLHRDVSLGVRIEYQNPYHAARRLLEISAAPVIGAEGELLGGVVAALDVTERARAESALRESEERFRTMANGLPLIVWVHGPDGSQQFVNRTFCEFFGVDEAEMQGGRWQALMHPDDAPAYTAEFLSCLREHRFFRSETRVQRADGEWRWIESWARPRFSGSGEFLGFVGTSADITERKLAEEEMLAARAAAEQANLAKDHFLAVLSHELRTPLTPVLTAAGIMLDDAALDADRRAMLETIRRNVELEARLIDDLLDVTRISRGKVELSLADVDVHEKLREVVVMCDDEIRSSGLEVRLALDAADCHVRGDGARLQQVFWNLLRNAVKFTPTGGGAVTVRTVNPVPGEIAITVEDSGLGIEADALSRIFDPFEQGGRQVTRQFGGLGLGLAICKGLATLHGGSITAASDGLGTGASFTVTIPTVSPEAEPAAAQSGTETYSDSQQLHRVLVVEDHIDSAMLMARALRKTGCEVRLAHSVSEGLSAAREERFDLLISDIGLPDGTGLDLIRQLGADRPGRCIALSGYGMDDDIRRSREAGFDTHLVKPVNVKALRQEVRRLLE